MNANDNQSPVPPVIELTNVTKRFGSLLAVDDLSLSVPEGAIFGFLGPNGAGKSTTIRLLLALIRPDTGRIAIRGRSVIREHNAALGPVGAFIEDPDFYPNLSARRNLRLLSRMTGPADEMRIRQVLEIVDLAGRADDKVKSFSRGMRQRLGIAQALLGRPRVLILDEPTSGLDPAGIRAIRELIIRLAAEERMTVFLSSHILHEVEQTCSDVAVIHQGRLIKAGPVGELLRASGQVVTDFRVESPEAALKLLVGDPAVHHARIADGVVKLSADREEIPRLICLLVERGIAVRAVVPRTSLEDYFLSLTEEHNA